MAKPFPPRVLWIFAVWNLTLACYGQQSHVSRYFPLMTEPRRTRI